MSNFYQILLVILLVFINGFFVVAEFAIVKVRESQLKSNDSLNSKTVVHATAVLENSDAYLACTQLGITLASLALGWLGESVVNRMLTSFIYSTQINFSSEVVTITSIVCSFSFIAIMHIVFGELVPKSLAIYNPLKFTLAVAVPLRVCYIVLRPAIWLFNGMANLLIKPFKLVTEENIEENYSEDEIIAILSESQESGEIAETELKLIENVFEFDERKINKIITYRQHVKAIEVNSSIAQALHYAVEMEHSRYPVYDTDLDNIVGVVNTKDLIREVLIDENSKVSLASIMRVPLFVSENSKVTYALKQMQQKSSQIAFATNEVGEFSGLLTFEDIIEELVGEVQDEYDDEESIVAVKDNSIYRVLAHNSISDINKYLPQELPESQSYDTLSGLIVELYPEQEIKPGDEINIYAYQGKVIKMHRNSVEIIELNILTEPKTEI